MVKMNNNTQSYNRYSYVLNNPLKYTDPSGYFFKKIFKSITKAIKKVFSTAKRYSRVIASIGIAFIPGINVYAAGFLSGAISSKGNLKHAIIGAFSAGLTQAIGHAKAFTQIRATAFTKALAHGISQGAATRILGGSFKDGFIGGFSGSYIGSYLPKTNHDITNAMIDITASGAITRLAGGRFQDGARSGAFVYLFNHSFSNPHTHSSNDPNSPYQFTDTESGLPNYQKGVCGESQCLNIDLTDWDKSYKLEAYRNNKIFKPISDSLNAVPLKWMPIVVPIQDHLDYKIRVNDYLINK